MSTITAVKTKRRFRADSRSSQFFWDDTALAMLARALENFLASDQMTQNDLATKLGVSSTTLGNFRKNAMSPFCRPEPTTLARLAPYLTNPDTGKPFSAAEIIDFCSTPSQATTLIDYVELIQKRREESLLHLAIACEVSLGRLREVLESPENLNPMDRLMWLAVLGGKLGNVAKLAKLMGIKPSVCAG